MLLPYPLHRLQLGLTVAVVAGCGGGDLTVPLSTATLEITTSTSGAEQDADGYSVQIDAGTARAIGAAATLTMSDTTPGNHTVQLGEIAENCTVAGDNPRSVSTTAGQTATVSFVVTCVATTTAPIAFTAGAVEPGIFLVNPDGTGLKKLTDGRSPLWSPDRRKILFLGNGTLNVINADGSGEAALYKGPPWAEDYLWSPDGNRIAFITTTCPDPQCDLGFHSLRVMQADGSAQTLLTDNAYWPSWSPDGHKIVFLGSDGIDIIESDGSSKTLLTTQSFPSELAWSPDGGRIAFVSANVQLPNGDFAESDIFLISPDGTGLVNLTQDRQLETGPEWSLDGSKLVFSTGRIAVINRDGSGRTDLTLDPDDSYPKWSPDGRQIVFERYPPQSANSDLYVMQAEGSNPRNITNTPGGRDYSVDW
ncbi:MAG TPA: hypothetical protein VK535_06705 [Gemmatimonadales bacterium]|nr:hypothetical protein [Gemmatimonadales bacterium]